MSNTEKDDENVDETGNWHHVHRATPLLNFWQGLVAIAIVIAVNSQFWSAVPALWQMGLESGAVWVAAILGGTLVVIALLCGGIWLISGIWWRVNLYQLTDEEIQVRKGVLTKQQRSARYDRVQAVDLAEPLVPRLFGLVAVSVETAGGSGSSVEVAYLRRQQAEALRTTLLEKVHHRNPAVPEVPAAEEAAAWDVPADQSQHLPSSPGATAEKIIIPEIPIKRSLAAAAWNIPTIILAIAAVAFLVLITVTTVGLGFGPGLIGIAVGLAGSAWSVIDRSWRFSATLDESRGQRGVLTISYGAANRRRQALPLDRIHAVEITQPLLWRATGWWTLQVDVAGYGELTGSNKNISTKLLPVGSRSQAMELLSLLVDEPQETLEAVARPEGHSQPDYLAAPNAKWIAPIQHRQLGVTLAGRLAMVHSGRLVHRLKAIELSHIQELSYKRGLLAHLLGLATVRFDIVPGPVTMSARCLTVTDARQLLHRLRQRGLPAPKNPELDEPKAL